ncbi:MAG: hypothetical protein KC561_01455, partial [Myxococcales bacterium]|nr:hypothetical protein [Myxococcales bacterium]
STPPGSLGLEVNCSTNPSSLDDAWIRELGQDLRVLSASAQTRNQLDGVIREGFWRFGSTHFESDTAVEVHTFERYERVGSMEPVRPPEQVVDVERERQAWRLGRFLRDLDRVPD